MLDDDQEFYEEINKRKKDWPLTERRRFNFMEKLQIKAKVYLKA